jgi:hypothetical protein
VILLLSCLGLLGGCGGGVGADAGNSNNVDTPAPRFDTAASFAENLDILERHFTPAAMDQFRSYDAAPDELINVFNWTQTNDVISGTYLHYAQNREPLPVVYPEPNGRIVFTPQSGKQELNYGSVDLANGAEGEGRFQTFFGVKDVEFVGGQAVVPIIIIVRGIATFSGVPMYRMVQTFRGHLLSYDDASPGGPTYDGRPGSLFVGRYSLYSVEKLHPAGFDRGLILSYKDYLVRCRTRSAACDPTNAGANAVGAIEDSSLQDL